MTPSSKNVAGFRRAGIFGIIALALIFLAFGIFIAEYTVLNFGDSDLPPYLPDTPFEKTVDAILYLVAIAAGIIWLYVIGLFIRAWKRRVA
jgi:divalent metal cation (Fe/Co/Zn/Cd) transporter